MQIHLPDPRDTALPLRARLLRNALLAHLHGRGDLLHAPVPRATGPRAVAETALLAALPAAPHAVPAASLGLGLSQALERGPARLLLLRPLEAELADFAGPEGWGDAQPGDVLRGYADAILLDRADLPGSVGFAPWIRLSLADRFPVEAPVPGPAAEADPRLLILDHGAPRGQARALARVLADLGPSVTLAEGQEGGEHALAADLHIHLGYGPDRAVHGFSPFDSLMAGLYTLVLTVPDRAPGGALQEAVAARSYAALPDSLPALEARAREMVARWRAIRATGQALNPETRRFAAQNAAYRAACLARFDRLLDAAPGAARKAA